MQDGYEAMDYLLRRGVHQDSSLAPRPDLILLDLNLPRVNGRQVLERLKQHPELDRIPTIVLTTSNQEQDILASYDLGCNSFIQKPVDMGQFLEVVRKLGHYWFELVVLPSSCEPEKQVPTIRHKSLAP